MIDDTVVWHDVECGSYAADLPLWRELAGSADRPPGPVLDLGAGTGRVTLDLLRRGHEVHALDIDAELLAALRERAQDLAVRIHVGDARDFDLGLRFGLVLAPMQTVQLLGGRSERVSCLRAVRRHLAAGALFAAALADTVEGFEAEGVHQPVPDMREVEGVVYASRPVAVRVDAGAFVLQRVREKVATDGTHEVSDDEIRLDRVLPETLEEEAREAGFDVLARRPVPETAEHVGSQVVVLRG